MTEIHDADQLRARLRAADPAGALPPEDPAAVSRLLADVMSTELTTESRSTGARHRGPLTWAVAAAAAVVIGAVALVGVRALTDDPAPPQAGDTVTELEVPTSSGRCMVPNPETLAAADVAFDGSVTAIEDDRVTLVPTSWYAGGSSGTVVLTAPPEQLQELGLATAFEEGDRYLVAAVGDRVMLCGFSGPYDAGLAAIYDQAFP